MSLKSKVLAGLAAIGLASGSVMLSLPHAQAATQKCGGVCATLASQKFGPKNVASVQGSAVMLAPFWYNSGEDLVGYPVGTVHDYYLAHLIAKSVDKIYGADVVYEYEWAPRGWERVSCLGVSAARPGTPVTLQECGASAATLWIAATDRQSGNYMPLISAAASGKSAMALTATSVTGPLSITQLSLSTTVTNGVSTTTCAPTQMWEVEQGAYRASTETSVTGS